jgi:regulatory protein
MVATTPGKPPPSLLQCAVALLARREHSRAELAAKLLRRLDEGQGNADVERVLDELQRRGLLSEERYAAAVVRTRSARYGNARLKQELKARGVPAPAAAAALAATSASEFERAKAVWMRRFGVLPTSLAERARQVRFLQSRGFDSAVVRRILKGLPGDDEVG